MNQIIEKTDVTTRGNTIIGLISISYGFYAIVLQFLTLITPHPVSPIEIVTYLFSVLIYTIMMLSLKRLLNSVLLYRDVDRLIVLSIIGNMLAYAIFGLHWLFEFFGLHFFSFSKEFTDTLSWVLQFVVWVILGIVHFIFGRQIKTINSPLSKYFNYYGNLNIAFGLANISIIGIILANLISGFSNMILGLIFLKSKQLTLTQESN